MKSYTCTLSAPFYETHSELLDTSDPNLIEHIQTLGIQSFESNKEYDELPTWLKNMPDDPSLLLRNKMQIEYQKRSANKPVLHENNGEIW